MLRLAILLFGIIAFLAIYAPHLLEAGPGRAAETIRSDGGIAVRPFEPRARAPEVLATGDGARLRRDASGHFRTEATVNGQPVTMMVDTGASLVVLNVATARRLGVEPPPTAFTGIAQTVSGNVRVAPVRLDTLAIGPVRLKGVDAAVVEGDALSVSLLGQSFLRRLNEVTIRGDEMLLR